MARIIVYKQARVDGGVRIAAGVDHQEFFHEYRPGDPEEVDPVLQWSLDVRIEVAGLPETPEAAGSWLAEHGTEIKDGLSRVAEELRAGVDVRSLPSRRELFAADGVKAESYFSANSRLAGTQLADRFREFRDEWDSLVGRLHSSAAA
jgi:hypothetical protein